MSTNLVSDASFTRRKAVGTLQCGAVTFEDLAAKVSDCSSAKHGGDLGFFGPGKMQKAFEVRLRGGAVCGLCRVVLCRVVRVVIIASHRENGKFFFFFSFFFLVI